MNTYIGGTGPAHKAGLFLNLFKHLRADPRSGSGANTLILLDFFNYFFIEKIDYHCYSIARKEKAMKFGLSILGFLLLVGVIFGGIYTIINNYQVTRRKLNRKQKGKS